MESPDKIFLAFEHGFVAQASTSKKDANGNSIFLSEYNPIEYIRKDALLEWAKEKYNEYKQMDEDFQGDVFIGNRHALAEVIEKIESL